MRNAPISLVMSVRPSACSYQCDYH